MTNTSDYSVSEQFLPEKRHGDRDRVLRDAKVKFNNTETGCVVLDISENGARIGFHCSIFIPKRFIFELTDGTAYIVERRWLNGNVYGLKFISLATETTCS